MGGDSGEREAKERDSPRSDEGKESVIPGERRFEFSSGSSIRDFAQFLKSEAEKSAADRGLLGSFNRARADSGTWIYVPLRFSLDSVAFAGTLRLKLPSMSGGPGRMEARFTTSCRRGSEAVWTFVLRFGGPGEALLALHPGSRSELAKARIAELAKALGLENISVRVAESGEGVLIDEASEVDLDV